MKKIILMLLLMNGLFMSATETKVIVRVKAKDAKFIGSSLGGALVIIRDELTGEILAQGKTTGSTGNTNIIMSTPHQRGMALTDDETAKFMATIDLQEPTFVTVEVLSPVNHKQARVHAQTQMWLIPGKHILGDGIIVEISGFIVDILQPRTHQYIALSSVKGKDFIVQANIVMMCGCVIEKKGLWDSEKMEVKALVKRDGNQLTEVPLDFVSTNLFEGAFQIENAGEYEITIYAYDASSGNTGVDKVNYVIH